ncbi:TylF/MycF/NovP-related O-methyltransferase [Methanoregula sp.]|uniref:TylF/MycF/NovP-related O-methyltransferase n=1 Tax=Methanoregula sp. TaxID=2052170 RepID=UPI002BF5E9AE|nr:TylF/MycF/NovP-related O-methyltransferase [Methanoregula sp.]HVP97638.1 TylF/MycF/NovP-related O-methyltransferase [Methanoregula sp.]
MFEPFMGYDIAQRGRLPHYGSTERKRFSSDLKKIRSDTDLLLEDIEAYQIYMATRITRKIPGDIAEVGVYKGGSAKIICSMKGDRILHLFDTFAGLPRVDDVDAVWPFYEGKFAASYDEVKAYLASEKNVHLYKGLFPDTSGPVQDKTFSLVNLDVDTYESTKKCLEFFYPRMNPGGMIVSHDYLTAPGVRKAVDEYFADKPEPVVETSASQCIVIKL